MHDNIALLVAGEMNERNFKLKTLLPLHSVNVRDALYGSMRPQDGIPLEIKTSGIRQAAFAFFQNVTRLDNIALGMPMFVCMAKHVGEHGSIGMSWGEERVTASAVRVVPVGYEEAASEHTIRTFFSRRWETVAEYLDEFPELANDVQTALHNIESWSRLGDYAIDAWLASIITGAWTTFEVMATDLWECALNCHPHELTNMGDKSISLKMLQKYGYDLRAKMGTLLKDKLGARGLEEIRKGYELAFSKNRVNIDKAIMDESLTIIQAVRNVIVHRAGIVDEKFCEQAKKSVLLSRLEPDDKICLDGELVKALVEPVIQCCLDLLLAVDRWLQNH